MGTTLSTPAASGPDVHMGPVSRLFEFVTTLYSYRGYIIQSVARDLRKKYKRSSLGYLWSMLNPLLMLIVLTIVFSNLLPRVDNYAVFLFSALLGWQYFQGAVSESMSSIRGNVNLIQQVPMPKFIFTISIACSHFVNLLLTMAALFLVMLVVGHPPPWTVLLFPFVFLPLLCLTLGFGLLLAVSEVFFEDTKHLTKVVLQAWYFLSPVLYGPELMPPHIVKWLKLNPLYYPMVQLREIFYYGTVPELMPYLLSLSFGLLVLLFALYVFYRNEDKFIYFL